MGRLHGLKMNLQNTSLKPVQESEVRKVEIKTKFNLGDKVIIRGSRYEVESIKIEVDRNREKPLILYRGVQPVRDEFNISEMDREESLVADPQG